MGIIRWKSSRNAYDLQASQTPGKNKNNQQSQVPVHNSSSPLADNGGRNDNKVFALSITPQFTYMPNFATTKSLPNDIIQLTRYQRRPTINDAAIQRKPSIRNIFLGVPSAQQRRFSEDIRGPLLAASATIKNKETTRVLLLQVFIPFLLSGFGNVAAGLFLNYAQKWTVFRENTQFYMLLATVMAFKTNLEATLAARLSTCSNMGTIKGASKKFQAFVGNLALLQTQSVIFGSMAAILVIAIQSFTHGHLDVKLGFRVMATSVAAICVNELLSSIIILAVIVASEQAKVNPDNVSTLIAAMLGDFSSVFFVSITAAFFHTIHTYNWLFISTIVVLICMLPGFIYVAHNNSFTNGMFINTHLPLALAVSVATISGLVFDHAVLSFSRIAIYQAVVNGISVNLMAVQASRISTYLQQLNQVAPERAAQVAGRCLQSPVRALYAQDMNASVSRWLIAMSVPAVSVYLCAIFILCPNDVDVTFYLIVCCLSSAVAQVTIIQCLTYLVTPITWKIDWDPDNCVIPILMSISDCSGNAILLTAFMFLKYMGDPNSVGQDLSHGGGGGAAVVVDSGIAVH